MSTPATIAGSRAPAERQIGRGYDPQLGWSTILERRGTLDAVEAGIPDLVLAGARFEYRQDQHGPFHTLTATVPDALDGSDPPGADDLETYWFPETLDVQKDIFNSAKFAALDSTQRDYLREVRNGDDTHRGDIDPTGDPSEFLNLILKKQETYQTTRFALHRVAVAPLKWAGTQALTNVNKVFASTTSLRSLESVPTSLPFNLPDGQWLKGNPQFQRKSPGLWEIHSAWVHDADWSFIYEVAA